MSATGARVARVRAPTVAVAVAVLPAVAVVARRRFPGGGGAGFSLATGFAGLVAPTLPPASLTDGAVSAPYSAELSATYGASTQVTGSDASWTVTPALPAGLTLDPNTGAISGTPTVVVASATYTFSASWLSGGLVLARTSLPLELEVTGGSTTTTSGPTTTTTAAGGSTTLPPSTGAVDPTSAARSGTGSSSGLAFTGATLIPMTIFGGLALLGGIGFTLITRRRRRILRG